MSSDTYIGDKNVEISKREENVTDRQAGHPDSGRAKMKENRKRVWGMGIRERYPDKLMCWAAALTGTTKGGRRDDPILSSSEAGYSFPCAGMRQMFVSVIHIL